MEIILVVSTVQEVSTKGHKCRGAFENLADYDSKEQFLATARETLKLMNIAGEELAFILPVYFDANGDKHKLPKTSDIVTGTDVNETYWSYWKNADSAELA